MWGITTQSLVLNVFESWELNSPPTAHMCLTSLCGHPAAQGAGKPSIQGPMGRGPWP